MDSAIDSSCSYEKNGSIASATAHMKESWAQAKDAAQDVENLFEYRPKTIAFVALGAGLLLGYVTGILGGFARCRRNSSEATEAS